MNCHSIRLALMSILGLVTMAVHVESPLFGDELGTIRGVITFIGEAPALPRLPVIRDREAIGQESLADESLLLGEKAGIANAFVYLKQKPAGWKPTAAPAEAVSIEFRDGKFAPRALSLRVGQKLKLKNLMTVPTNYFGSPLQNSPFNMIVSPKGEQTADTQGQQAERFPFSVTSNIHPWLKSWVLELDHPFVAVTDHDGAFEIKNLPPGDHEFRVWHEHGGYLEKQLAVQVVAGQTNELELTYRYDTKQARLVRP